MSVDIVMPRLSDSMEEGVLIEWLVDDKSVVAIGDVIAEIETDKASMPYEADCSGVINFVLSEGESCAVGEKIAWIGSENEGQLSESEEPSSKDEKPEQPETAVETPQRTKEPKRQSVRIKASPLAKRIAEDKGVDLSQIQGTGPHGRIVKADIENFSDQSVAPSEPVSLEKTDIPLSSIQKTIAKRMTEAKRDVPHFYLETKVVVDKLVYARQVLQSSEDKTPSYNDIIVKACAWALRQHPQANSSYNESYNTFVRHDKINIGIAVASEGALIVPVIKDTDKKGIREIGLESRELAVKVRENRVTPEDLSGATFTVSNLGMYGVSSFQAIVNPPQAAILAVGAIEKTLVLKDDVPVEQNVLTLNLSCDHRVLYGAEAAEFLRSIKTALEEPLVLSL